jgi:uncharacterized protein (DUF1800 family)
MTLEGAIAAHRFGLGARPGEIERASRDPRAWLVEQLDAPAEQPAPLDGQAFLTGGALVADMVQYQKERAREKRMGTGEDPVKLFFKNRVQVYNREMAARYALGFTTDKPFAERLVRFWSNHFVVSAQNPRATTFVGAFEREAIRPYISTTFEDMLLAVVEHPAMLLYLDNAQSVGPDSFGAMMSGKGLNENLGRELMELYTLGVDGGYTQADVVAMAKLLTGWTIDRRGGGQNGFLYMNAIHEPGPITLRGKTYSGGQDGTVAAIRDLAHDPATARHIARKLAIHFIADDPPPESCAELEKTFLRTGGDLRALAQTVVNDPHAWRSELSKVRTPVEYVTAGYRMLNWPAKNADKQKQVQGAMAATRLMGESPLAAPAPKGWPDTSDAWSGPDAILNRIEWAKQVGARMPPELAKPMTAIAAAETLGALLRKETMAAMQQAATAGDAIALLLSSPEFQRR